MNKPVQLVIYSDRSNDKQALIMMPILIGIMIVGLGILSGATFELTSGGFFLVFFNFICYLVILCLRISAYCGIILFSVGTIFGLYSFFYKAPVAILNKDGIWIKYYCFVSWEDVKEINLYSMVTAGAMAAVGINVRDRELLFRKSRLGGKIGLFWAKLFGYYHIIISNTDISGEEILFFARKYNHN